MHIHTYLHIHLPTYRQAGRPTDRQTDRPTNRRTDRRTYACAHACIIRMHAHACMHACMRACMNPYPFVSISSHPSKPMVCLCLFVGAGNGHALGQEASVLHKWHTDHTEYCRIPRKRGMSISPCKSLVASIEIYTHECLLGWVPYPALLKLISSYACVIMWILWSYETKSALISPKFILPVSTTSDVNPIQI